MSPEQNGTEEVSFKEFTEYMASISPESWTRISEGYHGDTLAQAPQELQAVAQNITKSKSQTQLTKLFNLVSRSSQAAATT